MIPTQSLMTAEDVKLYKQSEALVNVCLNDGLLATAVPLNGNRRLARRNEGTGGEGQGRRNKNTITGINIA